jgi:hypothetical protein
MGMLYVITPVANRGVLTGRGCAAPTTFMWLDRTCIQVNFYAIAKTMPIVTAVVCFLSTQNMGS